MDIFITTIPYLNRDLLLSHSEFRHAKNAIRWCEDRWGKVDHSIWRYTDNIKIGEVIFEFISEDMRVEFLLTWG